MRMKACVISVYNEVHWRARVACLTVVRVCNELEVWPIRPSHSCFESTACPPFELNNFKIFKYFQIFSDSVFRQISILKTIHTFLCGELSPDGKVFFYVRALSLDFKIEAFSKVFESIASV